MGETEAEADPVRKAHGGLDAAAEFDGTSQIFNFHSPACRPSNRLASLFRRIAGPLTPLMEDFISRQQEVPKMKKFRLLNSVPLRGHYRCLKREWQVKRFRT